MTAPRIPAELSEVVRRLDKLEGLFPDGATITNDVLQSDGWSVKASDIITAIDAVRTELADALDGMVITLPEYGSKQVET